MIRRFVTVVSSAALLVFVAGCKSDDQSKASDQPASGEHPASAEEPAKSSEHPEHPK